MRKKIFLVVFMLMLMAAMVSPALAGGKNGGMNGNSEQVNPMCVMHEGAPLWLPNQAAMDAHTGHGDALCL